VRRTTTLLACLLVPLAGCGSGGGKTTGAASGSTAPRPRAPADAAPAPGCKAVAAPQPKGPQHIAQPKLRLDPKRTYVLRLTTNCGDIDIRLAVARAPKTTASVTWLARKGFYDGLTFHRIAHDPSGGDFVIQGGDPLGTGQGGPGYQVVERPPSSLHYTRDVVAMAKTELEAAGTSGSQFFIVTAEDTPLPPDYALLGKVVAGDEVVSRIAAARTRADETPLHPVVIERARVIER
jgi:cyclophilin family peptidyl-prolyl cis-trans isomerase